MCTVVVTVSVLCALLSQKLEKQLRDVAYGTRQYRVTAADEDDDEQVSGFCF